MNCSPPGSSLHGISYGPAFPAGEGRKDESSSPSLCRGDLKLPGPHMAYKWLFILWNFIQNCSHKLPPPSDSFENYTGTCCYHHGNLSFFLPMINGPEFRFHLVPWLPDSADRYYPKWPFACPLTQTISVTLRLIKNLSFDRIQFGTCTPKGSCTEQLKQILVCTRYYVKIYISFCCIIM